MVNKVVFSHKSDNYITPKWLFVELANEFPFVMDACTTEDNPLRTILYNTPEDNGLDEECGWESWTYCNPPYSQVSKWVEKAVYEQKRGIKSVLLLPARTDTKWFHEYIYNKPNVEIRFLKGRLKFEGTENSAPFPSMIVIFW